MIKRLGLLTLVFHCLYFQPLAGSVGVYFGTFDPPHNGHLGVAFSALQELSLDSLYMLPNVKPSTKIHASSFQDRYTMVELITLREKSIHTLDQATMRQIYQNNPDDYISDLVAEVRRQAGGDATLYHICGTDSFLKMDQYKKLPVEGENRIIAVLPRTGYTLTWSPAMLAAKKRGQVVVLKGNSRHLSSTKIRKTFHKGERPPALDLKDYIQSYARIKGLYGYSEPKVSLMDLLDLEIEKYKTRFLRLPDSSGVDLEKVQVLSSINPAEWREPMTLRVDEYMETHFPKMVLDLVKGGIPTIVLGDLLPRALSSLRELGFQYTVGWFPVQNRIRYAYFVAYREGKPHLVITHLFGMSRLLHLTYQFSRYRAMLGMEDPVQVYKAKDYSKFGENLLKQSLGGIEAQKCHVGIFGYRGAFKHLLSDVYAYMRKHGQDNFQNLSLAALDQFVAKNGRWLLDPQEAGSLYFPFYTYEFPTPKETCQIISTRNLYGDQTHLFLRALEERGFRNFVLFGNSGGLNDTVEIGQVYAPYSDHDLHENQAAIDYPRAKASSVASVMAETDYWLKMLRNKGVQLVDVEMEHAFAYPSRHDLSLYAGLLVSDKPGGADISHKDENDPDMIAAKRGFFLKVLQRVHQAGGR